MERTPNRLFGRLCFQGEINELLHRVGKGADRFRIGRRQGEYPSSGSPARPAARGMRTRTTGQARTGISRSVPTRVVYRMVVRESSNAKLGQHQNAFLS